MISYDYYCNKCGTTEEFHLPMNHNAPEHDCGCTMVQIISPPNLDFKGDGWTKKLKPKIKNQWSQYQT